jgi:nucleoside-diphosphate-sugar epimerase
MGKQSSKMENILITGHLGYVGASLIKFLKQTYPTCKLIGFDTQYFLKDRHPNLSMYNYLNILQRIKY